MPQVKLKGPWQIAGAIRYPSEGYLPVSDDEYQRLVESDMIEDEFDLEADPADGLDDLTIPALKDLAATDKIDLGDSTRKDDIIAAIRSHRAMGA